MKKDNQEEDGPKKEVTFAANANDANASGNKHTDVTAATSSETESDDQYDSTTSTTKSATSKQDATRPLSAKVAVAFSLAVLLHTLPVIVAWLWNQMASNQLEEEEEEEEAQAQLRGLQRTQQFFYETSPPMAMLLATMAVLLVIMVKVTKRIFCSWLEQQYFENELEHDGTDEDCANRDATLKMAFHHFVRDSGLFIYLASFAALKNAGQILRQHPGVILESVRLLLGRTVISYGEHPMQHLEVFLPSSNTSDKECKGLLVFVHGGAWGSGNPSMYRLIASTFLRQNWAVAIVGYRVYPVGDASLQIQDVELALSALAQHYPDLCCQGKKVCLTGHSSGAHICLLALVERARKRLQFEQSILCATNDDNNNNNNNTNNDAAFLKARKQQWEHPLVNLDSFIGISGPYNIQHHFAFEASRGLEQLSPMQPACGYSEELFLRFSPAEQLANLILDPSLSATERDLLLNSLPPKISLVHGLNDGTVPPSSSKELSRVFQQCGVKNCKEYYMQHTAHEDAIMQFMVPLGGPTHELVTSLL